MSRGLIDTSVLIARGEGAEQELPEEVAISAMTLAEMHLGVLLAATPATRARRLGAVAEVEREFDPIAIDDVVARSFAALVADARERGRRPKVAAALIAATAVAHGLPLYTRDHGFEGMSGVDLTLLT